MQLNARRWLLPLMVWTIAGCSTTEFDPPELLGPVALVNDADQPRLC